MIIDILACYIYILLALIQLAKNEQMRGVLSQVCEIKTFLSVI